MNSKRRKLYAENLGSGRDGKKTNEKTTESSKPQSESPRRGERKEPRA